MPFETVQYPGHPNNTPTETSVHWSKPDAGGHVQLRVQRHHLADQRCPNGCDEHNARPDVRAKMGCTECPPHADPVPIGAIRASDDGHVARKVSSAHTSLDGPVEHGNDDWQVWRREGSTETVKESQIQSWPVVWMPEGGVVAADVYTEVFDRPNINRMIRVLRRARDDAYGADA